MKGTSLLECDLATGKLSEVARNYQTQWVTSVVLLDRETIVSADAEGNVIIQKWDVNGVTPEDRQRLSIVGEVRIGEMVNRFRKGIHRLPPPPFLLLVALLIQEYSSQSTTCISSPKPPSPHAHTLAPSTAASTSSASSPLPIQTS